MHGGGWGDETLEENLYCVSEALCMSTKESHVSAAVIHMLRIV